MPTLVEDLVSCTVSTVSCGHEHTIATNRQGEVFAWGLNTKGMLGIGKTTAYMSRPIKVQKLEKIIQTSCGVKHSLFLDIYGHAFACGSNKLGRLGIDTEANPKETQYIPVSVKLDVRISQLAAGDSHSLFVGHKEGLVYACGDNSAG